MPSDRITFPNANGQQLAGIVELPSETPVAFAVFAHCFTCGKDLKATVRVSRHLATLGIATLRFDMTGIGDSQGNFKDANFESNVADLLAAIEWTAAHHQSPGLLIGHSLGGAAAMAVSAMAANATAGPLVSLSALVTLASPSDTVHLADFLLSQDPQIQATGQGNVTIGGRAWPISMQLIDSLRSRDLTHEIQQIRIPHLILHSPDDKTVKWQNAMTLLDQSGGATSLVTLDGSDHLLIKQKQDVNFVAQTIATWSSRYLPTPKRA